MRTVLYLRVSTLNGQSTDNQRLELERVAERHGWQTVEVYEDAGISGARGRENRPAFDRMLKGAVRREFDVILAWSVDRLGRSLQELVTFLSEIHAKGVELYLHQQGIDTTTPTGKAMFQMMGVFAELERAMIRERVFAGLRRPSLRTSAAKSRLQPLVRRLRDRHPGRGCRARACGRRASRRQPLLAIEPEQPLVIHHDAFPPEQDEQAPIAEATPLQGQLAQPLAQPGIVGTTGPVAVGLGGEADQPTGPPLGVAPLLDGPGHGLPPGTGRQSFF